MLMWTHALTLQSSSEALLEDSVQSSVAVEGNNMKHLQEMQEIYETELTEMKGTFENQLATERQRC